MASVIYIYIYIYAYIQTVYDCYCACVRACVFANALSDIAIGSLYLMFIQLDEVDSGTATDDDDDVALGGTDLTGNPAPQSPGGTGLYSAFSQCFVF